MAKSRLVEVAFCNRRRIVVADLLDFCLVFLLVGVFCFFYINQLQCMAAGKFDWPQSPLVVLSSVPELATLRSHASELQVPTKKNKTQVLFSCQYSPWYSLSPSLQLPFPAASLFSQLKQSSCRLSSWICSHAHKLDLGP